MAERTVPAPAGLAPCPFCGDVAFLSLYQPRTSQVTKAGLWRVGCFNDECLIGPHEDYEDRDKAIAAWNLRAPFEAMLHAIAEAVFLHIDWKADRAEALRVVRLAADAPPPAREVTEEMVERGARALCVARGLNPDCLFWHESWDRDSRNEGKPWPNDAVLDNGKHAHWGWRHYTRDSRAALAAGLGEKQS